MPEYYIDMLSWTSFVYVNDIVKLQVWKYYSGTSTSHNSSPLCHKDLTLLPLCRCDGLLCYLQASQDNEEDDEDSPFAKHDRYVPPLNSPMAVRLDAGLLWCDCCYIVVCSCQVNIPALCVCLCCAWNRHCTAHLSVMSVYTKGSHSLWNVVFWLTV